MNEDCGQPVALHQYPSSLPVGNVYGVTPHSHPQTGQESISFAPSFDISQTNWGCHTFSPSTYHDMRAIQPNNYSEISALNYPDLNSMKYNYEDANNIYQKELVSTGNCDIEVSTTDSGSIKDEKLVTSSTSDGGGSSSSAECGFQMSSDTILMPMVKRGRPTENPCWSYFHRIDDQLVRCRICTKLVKSACATNMTKHLERHHANDYEKLSEQIRLYRLNDASFRTKIQYLTHMNPPQFQQQQISMQSTDVYDVPKVEPYESTPLPPYYESQDPTMSTSNGTGYQPGFVEGDWQLSHFWPQANVIQTPQSTQPSSSSSSSVSSQHKVVPMQESMNGIVLTQCGTQVASTSAIATNVITSTNAINNRKNCGNIPRNKPSTAATHWPSTGNERPYMKRNRKTEHPVWEYFKRTGDGNAECTICSGVVKSPCSSNFMRHLMRHHASEYNKVYLKWVQKRDEAPDMNSDIMRSRLRIVKPQYM